MSLWSVGLIWTSIKLRPTTNQIDNWPICLLARSVSHSLVGFSSLRPLSVPTNASFAANLPSIAELESCLLSWDNSLFLGFKTIRCLVSRTRPHRLRLGRKIPYATYLPENCPTWLLSQNLTNTIRAMPISHSCMCCRCNATCCHCNATCCAHVSQSALGLYCNWGGEGAKILEHVRPQWRTEELH